VVGAVLSREVVAIWAVTLSTGADIFVEVLVVEEHEQSKPCEVEETWSPGRPVKVTVNSCWLVEKMD
jgi:hypothetical protein